VVETADANFILTNASLTIGGTTDTLVSIESASLTGGSSNNIIDAGAFSGSTVLDGSGGNDTVIGGNGADILIGGAGDDILRGGAGNDIYRFDADTALGSDAIDELPGAIGTDVLDFAETQSSGVTIDLSLTSVQNVCPNLKITLTHGDSIEWVQGTDQDDNLRGNALDNLFISRFGADHIDGGAGTDTIAESRDADFKLTDTNLFIGAEKKFLTSIERAFLSGGDGNNTIDASDFSGSVTLSGGAGDDILSGGKGADILNGGNGNDKLYGHAGNDKLFGGAGDDELNGGGVEHGSGATDDDELHGNQGNDTYVFDVSQETGTDQVIELPGEGYMDVLKGAGLAGVQIQIRDPGPHPINPAHPTWIASVVLSSPTEIEDAF
jgi:Ca2+-binding RTX toxin-like protein